MKKNALIAVLLLCICHVQGQNFSGCVEIDFEDIPGGPYMEGSVINNQYLADFGIIFSLEDGTSPTLAEVGGAAAAFGSIWGNDTPAPGQNIGNFFLTDDGFLVGLDMIPVIVSFVEPIDSFSSCVLDIDLGEFFIMDARDQDGNIILSDTIRDGDLNTGDGIASCWGFNFGGCEGSVYSVRFEGFRSTPGFFGLGMDNFSFCFSGTDIANNVVVDVDDLSCDDETGAINILNFSDDFYQYSLDGINFQNNPIFENLPIGTYTVFVRDTTGCEAEFVDVLINEFVPLVIDDVAAFGTTCGNDNGVISVLTTPAEGARYSIDGVNFQEENFFNGLAPATYPIYIIDDENCLYTDEAVIVPSTAPVFDVITPVTDNCNDGNGQIIVAGSGGTGALSYTLNGQMSSGTGIFDSLLAGDYTIVITDEVGCTFSATATVEAGPSSTADIINSVTIDTDDLTCDETTGAINIANFGDDIYRYSLDGINYQDSPFFEDLSLGAYTVYIQDLLGCEATFINVTIDDYIPLLIDDVAAFATTCGEDNGVISVLTTPSAGVSYSLDNVSFQEANIFEDLSPGTYPIYILDDEDCLYTDEAIIDPSVAPVFDGITPVTDNCNDGNGQIIVTGSGGTGDLSYTLNGQINSSTGIFDALVAGNYSILMTDEAGCTLSAEALVEGGPLLLIEEVMAQDPTCESINGLINITASGGNGQLIYRLDGTNVSLDGDYNGLQAGNYEISITDVLGCSASAAASLEAPICPVFVPNVFSPNDDGLNDKFVLFTNPNYDVSILKCDIFDRWGELVWRSENFTLHTFRDWWDGTFRGQPATQGVYVYVAEVAYSNGFVEILAGDVALVR
jgi:gliding motility-associated-like protein